MSDLKLSVILQAVDRLTAPIRKTGESIRKLTDSQRRLKDSANQANQALDRQTRALAKMQKAREGLAKGLAVGGNMMFVGHAAGQVGRSAAGMLSGPIQAAANFEAAMSKVGAVSRANGDQLSQLTAKARELGATTRYSAAESAQGMQYLAMAGFSTEQMMASLPGVMNMATAGAADLGRASDIASDILSAFGLDASQMERVADTLTATFTRSNTSLEMLGETMKYVGPVARGAGMSLEETSAMAGLLGNVGIKASQAGTTLRAMLQRLSAPTGAAAQTLSSLGVEVYDLEGNLRSVPALLGELAEATADMGSGERLATLKSLFDAEAAAGVSELIAQQGAQGITQFTEILASAGGEASRVARQMDSNASGGFKAMNSAVEGLQIAFGDLLLPAVQAVTRAITGVTRWLSNFVKEWPNLSKWVGFGVAAIAGLAFALSGLMTVLAGAVGGFVLLKFGLASLGLTAIPAVIAGIKAMGLALMTNPIGLIAVGIATAATLIYTYWDPILNWLSEKLGWVSDMASSVGSWFGFGDEGAAATAGSGIAAQVNRAASATPQGGEVSQSSAQYSVQINQQPGEDSEALADRVMRKIQDKEQQQRRGAQYDAY